MKNYQWTSLGITSGALLSIGFMLDINPTATFKIICAYVIGFILMSLYLNYEEKKKWKR